MNKLHLTKLKFTLRFSETSRLPQFVGNTIRGALGQSLDDNCRDVYDAVFKAESDASRPNPYVISAPYPSSGIYKAGDKLDFFITLFGSAGKYSQEVTAAAMMMCNGKLSNAKPDEAELVYSREWSDEGAESIPYCDVLSLDFLSPTELLRSKNPIYEPDFSELIDSLFTRISAVCENYGDSEFVVPYSLIARKPLVNAEFDLSRVLINSNNHPVKGFFGKISYYGDITRYLPYIDLGSQIHVGKKTTRSCGEYSFEI